jgi:hypothetical protein
MVATYGWHHPAIAVEPLRHGVDDLYHPQGAASPSDSPTSRKVVFGAGLSAKTLEVAAEGATSFSNSKMASMLDPKHAYKRSHTTDLAAAVAAASSSSAEGDPRKLGPSANVISSPKADSTNSATAASKPRGSIGVDEAMGLSEGQVEAMSGEELQKLAKKLIKESTQMKQKLNDSNSGEPLPAKPAINPAHAHRVSAMSNNGSRNRSPSLVVDFAEPRHQQRPSMIAAAR